MNYTAWNGQRDALLVATAARAQKNIANDELDALTGTRMQVRSVFDPLTLLNTDGKVEPYLAKSVTPNADYTVWTIKARSGVTFHDGTPFDGAEIGRAHV